MKKIIEILKNFDKWLTKIGHDMYPGLVRHMKDKK